MSAFGGVSLTNRGLALQTKVQSGKLLKFTRIALGDGEINGSIFDKTSLTREVKSLSISKFRVLESGKVAIGGILTNQDVTTGFYWRELGVYAEDPDTKAEVLYVYGNARTNAEYIPASGGSDIIEKTIDVIVLVDRASNVNAVINQSLLFETPEGAQEKADLAKQAANQYTDTKLRGYVTSGEADGFALEMEAIKKDVTAHKADDAIHVTAEKQTVWNNKQDALSAENRRKITFGTVDPTGGVDGDIYFQYE